MNEVVKEKYFLLLSHFIIMKIFIFISLLFFKREGNIEVSNKILQSNIPQSCKTLFLAITIKESNWHRYKKAIQYNNYSGFTSKKGKLLKFKSLNNYIKFTEKWFKRKKINDRDDLLKFIKKGKYAKFNNKKQRNKYISNIKKIENQLSYENLCL